MTDLKHLEAERARLRAAIMADRIRQEAEDRRDDILADLCCWAFFFFVGAAAGLKIAGA